MAEQDQAEEESVERPPLARLDRLLSICEGLTAILVTVLIWAVILSIVYWIVVGAEAKTKLDAVHSRLVEALGEVHKNWKVGLLLLIPLFYRPARTFLLLVEEAWGVKTGPRAPRGRTTRPNPPEKP